MQNNAFPESFPLSSALQAIENVDEDAFSAFLCALIQRYRVLHPGWELCFLTLPLDDQEARMRQIAFITDYLRTDPRT